MEIELKRARELDDVEVDTLLAQGQWTQAVTRSYFGLFCLARALVFAQQLSPADETRELRNLDRLDDEAQQVAWTEAAARQARGGLKAFRLAVEKRLRETDGTE